jgi:hypothetical protein
MEGILYVFYNVPCFFSQAELELFFGFKFPNHNVDGVLQRIIIESNMIVSDIDIIGTGQYYLGEFGFTLLGRHQLPNINIRNAKYLRSITICAQNGQR